LPAVVLPPTFAALNESDSKVADPINKPKNNFMTFRFAISILLFTALFLNLNAQSVNLKPGQVQLGIGIGLVSTYAADVTNSVVPPLSAQLDVFVNPNFSLGGFLAYSKAEGETVYQNAGIAEAFVNETVMAGLRTTVHSNDLNNWRIYGGFMIGASLPSIDKTVSLLPGELQRDDELPTFSRPAQNSLLFSGFVGTRRYLNDKWSVYGELGFGISLVNVGTSYKF
jgi:hypothetical protein